MTPSTSMNSTCYFLSAPPSSDSRSNSQSESSGLKMQVNPLEWFSGDPIEFEEWEIGEVAALGQTVYGAFLENPPAAGNSIEEVVLINVALMSLHSHAWQLK